jgi:hypothetical protein
VPQRVSIAGTRNFRRSWFEHVLTHYFRRHGADASAGNAYGGGRLLDV